MSQRVPKSWKLKMNKSKSKATNKEQRVNIIANKVQRNRRTMVILLSTNPNHPRKRA